MSAEDDVERWILSEGHTAFEVTAVNPDTGKSKLLAPDELKEILGLIVEVERVLRGKEEKPAAGFSDRFRMLGLDPSWYADVSVRKWPLFIARHRTAETPGKNLKELMAALSAAGHEAVGLPPKAAALGKPGDKRVFIADDQESVRELLALILRREGFEVELFSDGAKLVEAVRAKASTRPPHLVLLDLMMPGMGGFDVLRQLQSGETGGIPILIISARQMDVGLAEALRHEPNVVGVLPKQIASQSLAETAHKTLKTRPNRP